MPHRFHNQIPPTNKFPTPNKKDYSYKDQDELRRKKLCFSFQWPWIFGHIGAKGKEHCIIVIYEDDDEGDNDDQWDTVKIVVMFGVPIFSTLHFKGLVIGKKSIVLVDRISTHDFIHTTMVKKINIPKK